MKETATNREVKRYNRNRIYRYLLEQERTSKHALSQGLGLSMPTVLQNTRELEEAGLLTTAGSYQSTGGRKAQAVVPVRDAALAVGMDVTRNHVSLVLCDLCGGILKHTRVYLPFIEDERYRQKLKTVTDQFLSEVDKAKLLGAAIIIPGIVAHDGSRILHSHVLGIQTHSAMLDNIFDCPVRYVNDSNAAAFAEFRGLHDRAIYLSLSNSMGGALYEEQTLVEGDHCRAGEFGHMTLYPDGIRCYCGRQGCADSYLSAAVLSEGNRLEDFFARVELQDPRAEQALNRYLGNLAIMVNNLRMAFDCDIMLGGYVGSFLEPYLKTLQNLVQARSTFDTEINFLHLCRYRVEAAALGGALQFIEEFIETV